MTDYEGAGAAWQKVAQGYASQWEYVSDLLCLLDYRLYLFYKYHQWLGPQSDMKNLLGLVVSREEFERGLSQAAQRGLLERANGEELEQIRLGELAVELRLKRTERALNLQRLGERFALSSFERQCVFMAYAGAVDGKYEKLFAYLQDNITKTLPTISLAVQLYLPGGATVEEYMTYFERDTLFTTLFDRGRLAEGALSLGRWVREYLSCGNVTLPPAMKLFDGAREAPKGPLVIRGQLAQRLDALPEDGRQALALTGPLGGGKRFQVEHLMARRGQSCLFVDTAAYGHSARAAEEGALLSRLLGANLCLYALDTEDENGALQPPPRELMRAIDRAQIYKGLFLLSQKPLGRLDRLCQDLYIEPATAGERLALFRHFFSGAGLCAASPEELAAKFRFEPLQIERSARQALCLEGGQADAAAVHRCCYSQVVHKLDKLATRVTPRFTWEDVVLPQEEKRLMQHALAHIKYQHKVYHQWGFEKTVSYGKGLSMLFEGAPGTGKTMCAQVIAKKLNMELYKLNLSQVVSKYIGETEKNLQAVFNEARNSNSILFFDECDALFGKRSEVKDAHDRNANVEVAYLLQQLEEHDGVCLLATNLMQNIDAAFMRRITYVVHFPFPDARARKAIYLRCLPPQAPVSPEVDWGFIAEKFNLSGGHIKNIVLSAAFMAAQEDSEITMGHVLTAAVNELKKNDIVVVREELREYADLIFNAQPRSTDGEY